MEASFKIIMFPWLAHGHISPYLELSKRILKKKNFRLYFCSTAINFSSIKAFIDKNELQDSIELVELQLEPTDELPPYYHTTKNVPMNLSNVLHKAFQSANSSYSHIVSTLSPDLVIYDIFQPWAAKIAASQGIPAVHFNLNSGGSLSFVHHRYTLGEAEFPFGGIKVQDFEFDGVVTTLKFLYENIYDVDQDFLFGDFKHSCEFVLVKSSSPIEGKYLDYLSSLSHKKILPVGPLVDDHNETEESSEIITWLSKKCPRSTVYISFGSEYFLSGDEIKEIAKGLELVDVNFIWVLRFPIGVKVDVESILPPGFLDRVNGRGRVLTKWAPQKEILAHTSTGGFASHCGWSSVMESLYFGVPVIAMPMKLDQPINSKFLSEAGGCVEVPRCENEVFKGVDIAKAITKVILDDGGEVLRRRVHEMSIKMRMEEENEIDDVVEHLWQLCKKTQSNIKKNSEISTDAGPIWWYLVRVLGSSSSRPRHANWCVICKKETVGGVNPDDRLARRSSRVGDFTNSRP